MGDRHGARLGLQAHNSSSTSRAVSPSGPRPARFLPLPPLAHDNKCPVCEFCVLFEHMPSCRPSGFDNFQLAARSAFLFDLINTPGLKKRGEARIEPKAAWTSLLCPFARAGTHRSLRLLHVCPL